MIPQTHVIIANEIHTDVKQNLNVKLDKLQLVYGSIKPDLYSGFPKLKHFKPQSFDIICNEIKELSETAFIDNRAHLAYISQKIGIITHYVADYFCVPHNDRKTYKNHFWDHLKYERQLHVDFKQKSHEQKHTAVRLNGVDFTDLNQVKRFLDELHMKYESKPESFENDLDSSMFAVKAVTSLIVQHSLSQEMVCAVAV